MRRITEPIFYSSYSERELYLNNLLNSGAKEAAARVISLHYGNQGAVTSKEILRKYINRFDDPRMLFDLIMDVYTNDGYFFPKCIIQRAKQLSKAIPPEERLKGLPDGDPVTVWRGCYVVNPACGRFMRTEISWTTDKTQAIWFANRISNPNSVNDKGGVWEAIIPRDKIIAFTQERNESEVIQHMNVIEPHLLSITDDEWETALQHQHEQRMKHFESR